MYVKLQVRIRCTCKGQRSAMATSRGVVSERGLFCEDWTAADEVQLLEAVEEFGYGNW